MSEPRDQAEGLPGEDFFSPRKLLQARRPEKFSDSVEIRTAALDRSLLEYHLDSLTNRKQETDFERLAKRLIERTVCPNLLPQTGPTGGGDSKVDSETYPVSDDLSLVWHVGNARKAAAERWAFAFSAKKDWQDKLRSDIAKIAATKRGYKKAFFVTNQFIRDKERASEEDSLRKKHKLDIRIFDRSWILDRVFQDKLEDIVIEELHLATSLRPQLKQGPLDLQRREKLDELEARINTAATQGQFGIQHVADCIEAAELARSLDLPRTDVDGRFQRAQRAAKEHGSDHQQLNAAYQWAWATYWWFEDYLELPRQYSEVEKLAKGTLNAYDLELLSNLWFCLCGAVRFQQLTTEEAHLDERYLTLTAELERLAKEQGRPSTALQAEALALTVQLMHRLPDVDGILTQFEKLIRNCEGLVGFPLEPLVQILTEVGSLLEGRPAYDKLFETIVKVNHKRSGELAAAQLLLKRAAQQLDVERPCEAIRTIGRALHSLYKDESRNELIEALYLCGSAYEQVGLLWAARGTMLVAASIATSEFHAQTKVTPFQAICFKKMKWLELQLGRLPHTLAWHEVETAVRGVLAQGASPQKKAPAGETEFDVIVGILLLKADLWQLKQLSRIPDVLAKLRLFMSSCALKFALGYEDELPEDLEKPGAREKLRQFIALWRDQPAAEQLPAAPSLCEGQKVQLKSSILGCKIEAESDNISPCVEVAECILAALEGFLATGDDHHLYAREPVLTLRIRKSDFVDGPFKFEATDNGGRPHITVSCSGFNPHQMTREAQSEAKKRLFDLLVHVLTRVFLITDVKKLVRDLFQDEAALERAIDFTTSLVTTGNVLGYTPKTNIDMWSDPQVRCYTPKRDEEWDADERRARAAQGSAARAIPAKETGGRPPGLLTEPGGVKHTQMETVSLIRERLWDRVGWSGTGYFLTAMDGEPPIIALLFKDQLAAGEIFAEWRKELGQHDKDERLRLTIVRGINRKRPLSYRVVIGTNPTKDAFREGVRYVMISRLHTMEPSTDVNLNTFLASYKKIGFYVLAHAILPDRTAAPDLKMKDCIVKRELHVRQAWEIGPNDIDAMGVAEDDQPIIPSDKPAAPVLDLPRWRRSLR